MAGPGKLSWDSVEPWQKLLAAIIASGVKIDISSVATHFGTTYDTIENRLRPVKKQAKLLKDAVDKGSHDKVTSARKSPSRSRTPRKGGLDAVSNGRVVKTASSGKKGRRGAIKAEAVEHSFVIEEESADGDSGDGLGAVDFEMGMANMFD